MKKLLCGLSVLALAMMGSSTFASNLDQGTSAQAKPYLHLASDMGAENGSSNENDDSAMSDDSSSASDSSNDNASDSDGGGDSGTDME